MSIAWILYMLSIYAEKKQPSGTCYIILALLYIGDAVLLNAF